MSPGIPQIGDKIIKPSAMKHATKTLFACNSFLLKYSAHFDHNFPKKFVYSLNGSMTQLVTFRAGTRPAFAQNKSVDETECERILASRKGQSIRRRRIRRGFLRRSNAWSNGRSRD
jgi:hypothetical protein